MNAPLVVFFLSVVIAAILHVRSQIPLRRAERRLGRALNRKGVRYFAQDRILKLRMLRDPRSLFDQSDTPEIRLLKEQVIIQWRAARECFPKVLIVMLLGVGLSAVVVVVQSVFGTI